MTSDQYEASVLIYVRSVETRTVELFRSVICVCLQLSASPNKYTYLVTYWARQLTKQLAQIQPADNLHFCDNTTIDICSYFRSCSSYKCSFSDIQQRLWSWVYG